MCVYRHIYTCHGTYVEARGRHLCFTSLDIGTYIVYCYEHQADWPVSFCGFSCLCLLYPCGSTDIADVCISMSDFYVILEIWVAHWFISVITFKSLIALVPWHIYWGQRRELCVPTFAFYLASYRVSYCILLCTVNNFTYFLNKDFY